MKRILILAALLCAAVLTGCGAPASEPETAPQPAAPPEAQTQPEEPTGEEVTNMIKLTVADRTIHAELADTPAARELAVLLRNGPIVMPASNYGGFEKVCTLGTELPTDDVEITTQAGDIMLYRGSQIVIFYDSNSWAYTRLARVAAEDIPYLEEILSGSESEVTIELA